MRTEAEGSTDPETERVRRQSGKEREAQSRVGETEAGRGIWEYWEDGEGVQVGKTRGAKEFFLKMATGGHRETPAVTAIHREMC